MEPELKATNWNTDPDIAEVGELNEQDEACLKDIEHVLSKHNRLNRFGITLLHSHFRLADDEVFLEYTDKVNRSLISRPVRVSDLSPTQYRPTVWRFDGQKPQGCSYCPMDEQGNHYGYKESC